MDRKTIIAIVVAIGVMVLYPYWVKTFSPPPVESVPGVGVESVDEAAPMTSMSDMGSGISDMGSGDITDMGSTSTTAGPITGTIDAVKAAMSPGGKRTPLASSRPESVAGADEELITVETPLYKAVFTSLGGGLRSFELKNYKLTMEEGSKEVDMARGLGKDLPLQTLLNLKGVTSTPAFKASTSKDKISIMGDDSAELVYTWSSPDGVTATKRYVFNASGYTIGGKLTIANGTGDTVTGTATTLLTARYDEEFPRYHSGPLALIGEKAERTDLDETLSGQGRVNWVGLEDKFFLLALAPKSDLMLKWLGRFRGEDAATTELAFGIDLKPGYQTQFDYEAFIGPKEYKRLRDSGLALEHSIEFGIFSFMAKPTLVFLNFVHKYVKNYGLAIIILTILMKIVFYPLTKKSYKSMKDMALLAPQMKALREKFKDDKQKQNKEVMDLYKRHKVNPVGGCLPMLLQIPVFIALYEVLSVAIELRHAPFAFWLTDLSSKDPYYITPLLMGATMFIQQKMTPTAMDPTQAKMMLMMPVVFTFLFLNFPSGLVLYWLLNNILTIGQQWEVHRAKAA